MKTYREELKSYLASKYTPKTVAAYMNEIETFVSNHPKAANYKQAEVLEYIGELRNLGRHPRTLNRILGAIKSYYRFLSVSGKREDNPVRFLTLKHKINRDVQLQDLLDEEELERLLQFEGQIRFPTLTSRNYLMVSLLVYQGLRSKELDQLLLKDIDLEKGKVKIKKQAKTNGRELYLRENQIPIFEKYINEDRVKLLKGTKSEYLIIGQRRNKMTGEDITKHVIRIYRNYIPEKKVNAQIIRQSVITNLLKKGKDIRLVQVFAGHRYPDSTERYKQNNVDELQKEIEKYHPLK
ncbi:MAG: tyrosine-type recombinase/integrase [Bacteroidota bacterium]|nr:tyrosine-type recombinase/integrase [Bacteroidota bacterium]